MFTSLRFSVRYLVVWSVSLVCAWAIQGGVKGQDDLLNALDKPAGVHQAEDESPQSDADSKRQEILVKLLQGKKLIGHFTVDGRPMKDLHEDRYEIRSVKKLEEKDTWLLVSRIKYGDNDVTLPLAITILWAGDTPIIALDDFGIPGLGTFAARIVFHEGKYAGTWTHDQVGGHMFGRIEPIEDSESTSGNK